MAKAKKKSKNTRSVPKKLEPKKIRYAVVGLGYFAQMAVLPAFKHAKKNSELAALISDDPQKLKALGRKYNVNVLGNYREFETCLRSADIDAVYIALPNSMHCEFTERAAKIGLHVLCEKPMAVTSQDCHTMLQACHNNKVKMMIGYRLHFEKANLQAIQIANSGKIGEPRFFHSAFSMQVKQGNIRLNAELGGGTLYDIGIYCINAARYLFRAEPLEVTAMSSKGHAARFSDVDEMTGAVLRFPNGRLATFITSFGAADVSSYQIVGTKGSLLVEPAFEFAAGLGHTLKVGEKKTKQSFPKRDQVAPEIEYFSDCILNNKIPEPSGKEGLADVRIIEALYLSAKVGESIVLAEFEKKTRPSMEQENQKEPVEKQELIHASTPHP